MVENDKLSTGLYLVVGETTYEQDILGEQARHRYDRYATTPFLVSLPTYVNAAWNYECAAAPKSGLQYCYRVIFHDNKETIDNTPVTDMPVSKYFVTIQ